MKIILIGLRGVGKTTVGEALASRMKLPFFDTDRMIEEAIGRTVHQIFSDQGELAFREYETRALRKLGETPGKAVVATGGGIVLRPENQVLLPKLGKLIYLFAKPEVVIPRLKTSLKRPSLSGQPLDKETEFLFLTRDPIYRDLADLTVLAESRSVEDIAGEIESQLPKIQKVISKGRKSKDSGTH